MFLKFLYLLALFNFCRCSIGDKSPYYERCLLTCEKDFCGAGGDDFIDGYSQPLHLRLSLWSCRDECKYGCMWKTVDQFTARNWRIPQFYGKWPFVRIFGIQEPASVVFSLLNLYVHIKMIQKFRKVVRPDSPLFWLWHVFCLICCHAWLWSSAFHARDTPFTELMDYACAFSIILVNCYVMLIRTLRGILPRFVATGLSVFFLAFFANHSVYLGTGDFDYGYNMELNVLIGTFTAISWFSWSVYNKDRQPYVWKCAIYVSLTGLVLLLEVLDRPPFFYLFDTHSLWHLATAPLVVLIYSFAIDDCHYLRKIELEQVKDDLKSKIE
ncbi:post-GPI attachment to proteins factor 3 [Cylas formicarius]|uniref:post-GPI attachment to proteins factor 3 n=1 Tax=Cylas formicarius TaxID=197179 RepID=UPI002958CBA6|nr:post-GPI attachment to proteins factor 3 [Cylas formicarius]